MSVRTAAALTLAACLIASAPTLAAPERVRIEGYAGEAMEPFLSRDGKFLFFNTRNDPGSNTDIHFAEAQDGAFAYRGVLNGTMSYDLDAVPTMAADGRFCFVSPREYRRTRVSVMCGVFDGKRVNRVAPQAALATAELGRLIFDVELSADGATMIFAEGTFSGGEAPDESDLYLATLTPHGFQRAAESATVLANVNTSSLEYAPALSDDGLQLYFTRLTGFWPFRKTKILHAARTSLDEPFGKPVEVITDGFVEAPSVGADGALYFHKNVDGRYQIWRQAR